MKCDELKRFDIVGKYSDEDTMYEFKPDGECYDADEVDEAIAELKQKLHDAEMQADLAECAVTEYKIDCDKLKAENRRLNFQLWSARFEAAKAERDEPRMARCRYMADKFKEADK